MADKNINELRNYFDSFNKKDLINMLCDIAEEVGWRFP